MKTALLAKDKKALDVVVLDMRSVCTFCEFFVIASGNSLRQVNAIAQGITDGLVKDSQKPLAGIPSNDESGWVVIDYSDVVVHIFNKPVREFYALEDLWSDAKRVRISKKAAV